MSLEYVAFRQSTLKLKTELPTLFTSWLTQGNPFRFVAYAIVVLTKQAFACEICVSAEY